MNTINPIRPQQINATQAASSLRQAAANQDLPDLTKDESSLIQEKFTPSRKLDLYTVDGRVNNQSYGRGLNLDTRI